MRTKVTKWMAGISSAAMLASFSALSVPAFAAEYGTMQAEAYAASFESEKAQTVARYFLDNGVSMEETEQMMARYVNGVAMIESEQNADDGVMVASTVTNAVPFYAETTLASTQHYGIFVVVDPKVETSTVLRATWATSAVTYDYGNASNANHIDLNGYTSDRFSYSTSNGNSTVRFSFSNDYVNKDKPLGLAMFAISPTTSITEAGFYNQFSLSANVDPVVEGEETTFEFHTFALGDFNHDGIVNNVDYTNLVDFCMMSFDGKFHYTDVGDGMALAVNRTAIDMNFDGVIDIRDASAWNTMMQ